MSDYVPDISEELLAGFVDEAPEYLEILDDGLMALEQKAQAGNGLITLDSPEDHSRMNEMFRAAHSFKGLGAAMGFDKIRDLTHVMETLFDQLRMGKLALADHAVETLFKVIDRLKALINELTAPPDAPVEIEDCVSALEAILRGEVADGDNESNQATTEVMNTVEADASPQTESSTDGIESMPTEVETAPGGKAVIPALGPDAAVLENSDLAHLFVDSTLETLDELNATLLKLEETPDDTEAINDVFRCAHNIKGATGAAGCTALYHMTHEMETVLDLVRSHELSLTPDMMQAIFAAADRVRADVTLIKNDDMASLTGEGTDGMFTTWLSGAVKTAAQPKSPPASTAAQPDASEDSPATTSAAPSAVEPVADGDMIIQVRFPKDFIEAEVQAYLIKNKLEEFGDVISTSPDVDTLDGSAALEDIRYFVNSSAQPAEIEKVIKSYTVESVHIRRGDEVSEAESVAAEQKPCAAASQQSEPATPTAAPKTTIAPEPAKKPASKTAPAPTPKAPVPVSTENAGQAADKKEPARPTAKPSETIRVDLERLDQLMNLGGELVINKARLTQIHGRFDPLFHGQNLSYLVNDMSERVNRLTNALETQAEAGSQNRRKSDIEDSIHSIADGFQTIRGAIEQFQEARGAMNDFSEALHALNRVSEGIQKGIMETRMVSVGPLFQRFRRVVRDISKATGKSVNLVLKGEQTELDKRMIDELGDPLTHMIRNSVDHGIETPEERAASGKPAVAEVTLNAFHRGRHICIEVRDDGKGVNIERVKAKIIERELATPAEVERMSHKEIVQYIFKPGFSTAEKVTDLSGRGMGMDIVLNKLEQINGTVEVDSVTGEGSVVTIKLPLTLAIITAILAKIGDYVYAIPLDAVAEIITATRSEIQYIQKKRVVRVRERVIPVAFFEQMFAVGSDSLRTRVRNEESLTLVILEMQNERVGLVVDELIGQEDVVIKSIAENFRNVSGITGASIMGDGRVSLILDVASMMSMFAERSDEWVENDAADSKSAGSTPAPIVQAASGNKIPGGRETTADNNAGKVVSKTAVIDAEQAKDNTRELAYAG
ncbi:MAG: Hpt domain-containing protein [Phycisphaerales bacterium]|nr:Hpt domain-containing protein [Phycisphaerales bacterium]MCB9862173.1 Hpt domain-containing protein [Phycisphaerales bacterium]